MKLGYKNPTFPFLLLLLFLAPILTIPKVESLLIINGWHTPFLDSLMKSITLFGEGYLIYFCLFILLFVRLKWFAAFVVGLLIHVFLIQINKQVIFNEVARPLCHLQNMQMEDLLYFIEGIRINEKISFPSGHTTGAAFAASFIAIVFKNMRVSFFLAIIPALVGLSRIYMAQHFFVDVYFGFFFGVFSAILGVLISSWFISKNSWYNKDLIIIYYLLRRKRAKMPIFKFDFNKILKSNI